MKAVARIWNFRKRRAFASRSSSRRTAAWFRSSSRAARGRKEQGQDAVLAGGEAVAGARARELHAGLCGLDRGRGRRGRRQLLCLTRFAPGSGRTPGFTRSATAHPGSSVKSSSSSATRAATFDFYHVCEYLAPPRQQSRPTRSRATPGWRRRGGAQRRASRRRPAGARRTLRASRNRRRAHVVRTCHRYLRARADQLNYRRALAEDCRSAPARSKAPTATSPSNA